MVSEPIQHTDPGIGRGGSVVSRSGVVEKRMVGIGFHDDVVDQVGTVEGGFGRRLGACDTGVEGPVERQHGGLGGGEVGVVRQRSVERHRGRQVRHAGSQQLPYQSAAEAKTDDGDFPARNAHLQFGDTGIQVRDKAVRLNSAQCGCGLSRVREVPGAALLGQQVDGQCRIAGTGETSGHRPHPIVQTLVLVDDQHPATGVVGLRPSTQKLSVWPCPGDRFGR